MAATSPGRSVVTAGPTSRTSPTPSWPIANGCSDPGTGVSACTITWSRSHVDTAIGRTSASVGSMISGSGSSRHSSADLPSQYKAFMDGPFVGYDDLRNAVTFSYLHNEVT